MNNDLISIVEAIAIAKETQSLSEQNTILVENTLFEVLHPFLFCLQ